MVAPKFIGVWSHPRSMSTSIERCFRERGDCRCHHEPFMYCYYLERLGQPYPNFNPEDKRPRRWQDIAGMLTSRPDTDEKPHIFFKDMSYYIDDLHDELADFIAATVSIFLIRDPRFTLASYHRLDPAFSLAEGGLESQWRHLATLQRRKLPFMVIEAETISADPASAVRAMCEFAGIPFIADALTWGEETIPDDWEQASAWHQASMKSAGFTAPDKRDPDDVFANAVKAGPHLRDYLDHHQPYYDRLKALAWQVGDQVSAVKA